MGDKTRRRLSLVVGWSKCICLCSLPCFLPCNPYLIPEYWYYQRQSPLTSPSRVSKGVWTVGAFKSQWANEGACEWEGERGERFLQLLGRGDGGGCKGNNQPRTKRLTPPPSPRVHFRTPTKGEMIERDNCQRTPFCMRARVYSMPKSSRWCWKRFFVHGEQMGGGGSRLLCMRRCAVRGEEVQRVSSRSRQMVVLLSPSHPLFLTLPRTPHLDSRQVFSLSDMNRFCLIIANTQYFEVSLRCRVKSITPERHF